MIKKRTSNYLNNYDLVQEIHKSKNTYSYYTDKKYNTYDIIIEDINVLNDEGACFAEFDKSFEEVVQDALKNKVKKLNRDIGEKKYTTDDFTVDDVVFRWMTYDHIPADDFWPDDKEKKKPADGFCKVNFPPFQHYILKNGNPICVGYSHYDENEKFNTAHGNITNKLGHMYMLLVERISKKGNWRNYTYIDEMKSSALLQLSQVGLQFNESRGLVLNPFAFYTTVVNNAFKRVLNTEKKVRDIRDDLLEMNGQNPSFTRQTEIDVINSDKDFYDQWKTPTGELRKDHSPLAKAAAARKRKEAIAANQKQKKKTRDDV